jgi:hypothetical protein
MQLQIQIEKQLGDTSGAWDLEHELLALLRRHPDDLRTVPILHEIADEQMDVLRRYVAGEFPPEVVLGCFYSPQPTSPDANCRGGSRRQVIQGMLLEARRNYRDATNVLVHNSLYSSDELRDLEMELLRGADWVRALDAADWTTTQAAQGAGFNSYYHGLQSLRRLYAYDVASTGSFTNRIDAIIQLADWELLYSHNGTALEGYEFARALLTASGASQASIDQRFAPEAPVVLPAFEPNPLLAAESQATGYVDVAFEVTTYGRSRRIDVRGGANASPAAKERVVHQIARSRFRPRLSDGEFGTAPLVVRYYLRN